MLVGIGMVLSLTLFIVVHEAGHYLTARATGMKATEFFVGFGPRIWSFKRGETEYGIKAFPLGGYVRILGMDSREEVDPADLDRTYREKPFWRKSVVVLSGVVMNLVLAFLLLFTAFLVQGTTKNTTTLSRVATYSDGQATPAQEAGILPGDTIVAIDGLPVSQWSEISNLIVRSPGAQMKINIIRDGDPLTLTTDLDSRTLQDGSAIGFLGISPQAERGSISPVLAAGRALQTEWDIGFGTIKAIGGVFHPQSLLEFLGVLGGDTEIPNEIRLVSPIGLVNIGSQVEQTGAINLLLLMAVVNITLAIFNSIPLPPLDGGHFAVAVYERITGRKANPRKLIPVAVAVVGIMLFLGLVAIVLDIFNPLTLG